MITYGKFLELVKIAEEMNCRVIFSSRERISFKINMTITVPMSTTLDNVYALAHEIGHLIDYVNDDLDYDKWLSDWSYRIHAEMSAWVNAYKVLRKLDIPLDGWKEHVDEKLSTYFKHAEVK